jgi:hypothetical protein
MTTMQRIQALAAAIAPLDAEQMAKAAQHLRQYQHRHLCS